MANNSIDTRSLWLFGYKGTILDNKQMLIDAYMKDMQKKTLRMFEWKNLPESIPQRELELILQLCRFAIFTKAPTKDGDKLFVFYGGLGGMPNEYYQPTQAIVVNPYLKFFDVLKLDDYIKKDGNAIVGWTDSTHMGMYPMNSLYASLLAETSLTLKYQLINMRFNNVLTANDDNEKESLKTMYKDVADGTGFGIIVTKRLMNQNTIDKIDITASNRQAQLKDTIETMQYLKGSWLNAVGLNANYNMKRESINESECDLNEDALIPDTDDMLECRKLIAKQLNEKFSDLLDGEISVDFSSAWKKNRKEIELREEQQESQIGKNKQQEENPQEDVSDGEEDEKNKN